MNDQTPPTANESQAALERLADRVTELELINTHLERTVEQLNAALLDQSRQVQSMQLQLNKLSAWVEAAGSSSQPFKPEEEIPPHY
jgi:uncharacterized coiled-coil protein SlyX